MALRGKIFDIQSFSVHDGPGCRTDIFMTGCPLKCIWCANPESWMLDKHLMFSKRVCKWEDGCRACTDVCQNNSISKGESGIEVDWQVCKNCKSFACTAICPNEALKQCVKDYSVEELIKVIRRDCSQWGPDGGVTFTGGDPLVQSDFLLEVLKECQRLLIHTAIETSACVPEDVFLKIMKYIQFAFIDVKHMEDEEHFNGTGVSNAQILSNIRALTGSGWNGRLVLRQPVIGGYNDSDANALKVAAFMEECGLYEINLLRFHRMGETKWNQLGLEYAYHKGGETGMEELEHLQSIYLKHDIACYIGEETPF